MSLETAITHDATGSVLLVGDDETFIRMNAVAILEDAGFEVLEVADADEAIAMLEHAPEVRLMFSDVDMPGSMNGVDLATRLSGSDVAAIITPRPNAAEMPGTGDH